MTNTTKHKKKPTRVQSPVRLGGKEKMVRMNVSVPDRVKISLEQYAQERGENRDEIIRNAMVKYMASETAEKQLVELVLDNGLSSGTSATLNQEYWKNKGIASNLKVQNAKTQMKPAKVRIKPAADRDIDTMADSLGQIDAAMRRQFLKSVRITIEHLAQVPEIGSPFEFLLSPRIRRCHVAGFPNAIVFYLLGKAAISILRVLDATDKSWQLRVGIF